MIDTLASARHADGRLYAAGEGALRSRPDHPVEIAHRHGKSPEQVTLRWLIQQDAGSPPSRAQVPRRKPQREFRHFRLRTFGRGDVPHHALARRRAAGESRLGAGLGRRMMTRQTGVYDYIIVGAGSAGCVIANRLSADPGRPACCSVEAGRSDRDLMLHVPGAASATRPRLSFNWSYLTDRKTRLRGPHDCSGRRARRSVDRAPSTA